MKKIRLFTLVWGERYIDWFERACVASLCWPKNADTLQQHAVAWDILTRHEDADRLRNIAARLGIPVEIRYLRDTGPNIGAVLQQALIDEMRLCLEQGQAMLLCPPDKIFGDGAIAGLVSQGDTCVAVPHVRVLPSILPGISHPVSNAELVGLAWKHLHRSWSEANLAREMANCNVGGVAWREITPGLYAVQHRLPTCFLANFQDDDLTWFCSQVFEGGWDHLWPAKLVAEQRQRVLASSDAAFMAEITPEFENIPACAPVDPLNPDKYWGQHAHHWANRNIVAIFRAAP